jgi:hypothetical protein
VRGWRSVGWCGRGRHTVCRTTSVPCRHNVGVWRQSPLPGHCARPLPPGLYPPNNFCYLSLISTTHLQQLPRLSGWSISFALTGLSFALLHACSLSKHACATQAQRPLTVGGEWTCLDHEDCSDGEYTCYFQPLTSCLRDSTTPSCGWVDNGQELDLPRAPLHPLCCPWEEEEHEEEEGNPAHLGTDDLGHSKFAPGGDGGGGVCVSHIARSQRVKARASRVSGRGCQRARVCVVAAENATSVSSKLFGARAP